MEKISFKDSFGRNGEYEVVNDFPFGYVVWNIGRHNFPCECYVPIAHDLGNYRVDKPKCIKVKDEETALKIIKAAEQETIDRDGFLKLLRL